ncbi:Lon protease (S16) C-terminal proteolytic domain-containing protein [Lysinibacillus sp. AC-3]|uniref:S16 family serine protease n=1 Tax=unclassified Lysinibacillus TaxID=2636778 RepID=UPI0009A562CC|nr:MULTISPECIES: S16 family serine protease [unclassified Lysinibacillus]SKB58213.1 Lon protease (S16) C-terminal proteolytic domain-containing protein [Lysinibacillus sp. AC-3]
MKNISNQKRRLPNIVTIFLIFLYYGVFLLLYLQGVIGGISFVAILLINLIILLIVRILLRKKIYKRNITLAISMMFLLFCFELPLIFYEGTLHVAYIYKEPLHARDTEIYLIGVERVDFQYMESIQSVENLLIKQQVPFFDVAEITNLEIYASKNKQILKWLHLQKNEVDEMKENVIHYLGKEDEHINDFFNQDNIGGNSAGLGLALTGLILRGDFQNNVAIAVTGAISENGDVLPIGVLKEKILIAEKYGLPYLIIPTKNAEEAAQIQEEQKSNVKILHVSHIDEAVQLINEMNGKNK